MNIRSLVAVFALLATVAGALHLAAQPTATRAGAFSVESPLPPSVWTTQWGGFNHFERIHAVSADSVWAVGSNLAHFDGRRWAAVDRRDHPARLIGVDVLPSGDGWAVGGHEAIPIADGKAGATVLVPGYSLLDVAAVDASNAWAVARSSAGGAPAILRYGAGEWRPEWTSSDNFTKLVSIWMASATEGWAVGSARAGAVALHYDGDSWTEWPLPVDASMNAVRGATTDDVWAVGGSFWPFDLQRNLNRRVILHFDGMGWTVVRDEAEPGIRALAVRANEAYAISETGEVFELRDGQSERADVRVPIESMPMHLVWDAAFVPGSAYTLVANYSGWVYRLDDERVTLVHDAAAFRRVAMLSDRAGWALGRKAMAFDGADWYELAPDSALHGASDIATVAGKEAWAVGGAGLAMRYRAGEWARMEVPHDADLIRAVAPAPGAVWMLGESLSATEGLTETLVLTYDDTNGWDEVWRGPGKAGDLAVADGRALLTTSAGIWHFDGAMWAQIRDEAAVSVGIGPAGELWAGDAGEIKEYAGREWVPKAWLPARARVLAFHKGTAASWAVADYGFVLAYDAGDWKIVRGDPDLNGVAGQHYALYDIASTAMSGGRSGLWAVGEPDTIIHSTESEVLGLPAIPPAPTPDDSRWPAALWPRAYFPRLDLRPPYRNPTCRSAPSGPTIDIEKVAGDTARYYAADGPAPEPTLTDLHMLTVTEIRAQYEVDLIGVEVAGRRVSEHECIWWSVFDGWFDAKSAATPAAPDYRWTRLDLALFGEDGRPRRVIYEAFSGRASEAPPTPISRPTVIPTVVPIP